MKGIVAPIAAVVRFVRRTWQLERNPRVPTWFKLLPVLALAFIASPVDLMPDAVPVIGQLGDIVIGVLLLALFSWLAPTIRRRAEAKRASGTVIDGRYRIIE